jgi:hypothetical protein
MKKFALIIFLFSAIAHAQQLPTLSYETPVFNQVTGPTISPVEQPGVSLNTNTCKTPNSSCWIANTGMGSHTVTFCITGGTVTALAIWLEGSNDNTVTSGVLTPTNWIQMSSEAVQPTGTVGCGTLEAAGYFQYLRLHLSTLSGTNPVISAWYSGIGTALPGASILQNRGSQFVSFNPSFVFRNDVKSTATTVTTVTQSFYAGQAVNPNGVPVFVTLTCGQNGSTVIPMWEIPANDTRNLDFGSPGAQCQATPSITVACSTSASSAVDPASPCPVTLYGKSFIPLATQVNFAGTVGATVSQPPN